MAKNKDKIIRHVEPIYKKISYDQKFEWDKTVLKYMKNCNKVLDVGCGIGRFISHDPLKIIGVDHSQDSLKTCKQKGFIVNMSRVTKLPFKDSSFDGVHCSHVIEHLFPQDAHQLLVELNRVLKSGGILCIRSPLLNSRFYYDFTHIKPYDPQAILGYLKTSKEDQTTLLDIPALYKIIKLKYRRGQLFPDKFITNLWFLTPFGKILYKFGIRSFEKTGYMLILKKIT